MASRAVEEAVDHIIGVARGFPHYAHLLALSSARAGLTKVSTLCARRTSIRACSWP